MRRPGKAASHSLSVFLTFLELASYLLTSTCLCLPGLGLKARPTTTQPEYLFICVVVSFICISVLSACIYVCYLHAWYLWRLEEGVRSPFHSSCELAIWGLGIKPQVFLQDQVVLTNKPPFQAHGPNSDRLNSTHEHGSSLAQRIELRGPPGSVLLWM